MTLEQQLALCARHRAQLCLPRFDHLVAKRLGEHIFQYAQQHGVSVAMDITVNHHCWFSYAMQGTTAENLDWVRRKRNVVDLLAVSSYEAGLMLEQRGVTLEQRYGVSPRDYAALGGGFPLRVADAGVIGSVTVSGAPHLEDHNLLLEVLRIVAGLPDGAVEPLCAWSLPAESANPR